jgi:IclR family transcriptional regulator, acetate operon repressor
VGAGRVVAALLTGEELTQLIDEVVPFRLASGETVDEARFRASLDEVRARGYARSVNERVPGAASVGAPVLHADGRLIAVLQIAGPVESVEESEMKRYVAELNRAAMAIRDRI